ncbi:MAG: TonB-dependent receptor [Sediminibacterium sp.]|nr:TonB-dependent receptor [Sediminibacterium sp.]
MNKSRFCLWLFCLVVTRVSSQNIIENDTLTAKEFLPDVTVVGKDTRADIHQLPEIVGTYIFAGKKNALVVLNNVNGNIVTNNMRQVLAKVPGIHIWESDGSGIQIGIATRGLSPNRSWDFNVRQNGYDISADPFGYPEAYYNPPLQAVQRLQIVKGAGSMQYGPQLGGMLNYVLHNGSDIDKPFAVESQQTVGSFGLVNTFNAIGGKTGNNHYYGFFDHRNANGWRDNSRYKTNTGFVTVTHLFNNKWKLAAEVLRYSMLSQQPGGLTDSLFNTNAQPSLRSRNWLNIEWGTAALSLDYTLNEKNIFNLKVFGLHGDRSSIGYINAINNKDTVRAATLAYANRTIDVERYRNYGAELRYLSHYTLAGISNSLTAAARYYYGNTNRNRNGKGDAGTDFSTTILDATYPTELDFVNHNLAFAFENVIRLTKKFILIPGARWESVAGTADGRVGYQNNGSETRITKENRSRHFLLLGIGSEYHLGNTEWYANYTESYRPIQFGELTANPTTEVVDPALKDGRGWNIDLGYRGKIKQFLIFDFGAYYLNYANRIGIVTQQRTDLSTYNFRTNVGTSISKGFEGLVEINFMRANLLQKRAGEISVFASYSYTHARYENLKLITKGTGNTLVETNLQNKKVENAPGHILRSGINYFRKRLTVTGQLSYVSSTYADAANTEKPNAAATTGLIPAYTVLDFAVTYRMHPYQFKAGINNLTDTRYFTRRAGGFPGPGLMPAEARSFYISVGVKL